MSFLQMRHAKRLLLRKSICLSFGSTMKMLWTVTTTTRRTKLPLSRLFSAWFLACTGNANSFTSTSQVVATSAFQKTTTCVAFSSSDGTHSNTGSHSHSTALDMNMNTSSRPTSLMKVWDDGRNEAINKCILPLSSTSHKGSSGRIAVLGGSAVYTGAPYYAAMASLQTGADLAYIFTAQEAVTAIKCYSPELMVAPVYSATEFSNCDTSSESAQRLVDNMVQQVTERMSRLHCLVIGPGLGRCPLVFKAVAKIILSAREHNLFLILDADALYMLSLSEYRNIIQGYDKVVLTPNVVEYERLFADGNTSDDASDAFASAVFVTKGKHDGIHGAKPMVCEEEGGLKRSGGIGDVLAGTLSTLCAWHVILKDRNVATEADLPLSCWTACCFIKRATKRAFDSKRRSMTAPDVLDELGPSIDTMVD